MEKFGNPSKINRNIKAIFGETQEIQQKINEVNRKNKKINRQINEINEKIKDFHKDPGANVFRSVLLLGRAVACSFFAGLRCSFCCLVDVHSADQGNEKEKQ